MYVSVTDISPLAKRLAEENNVDWRRLNGSGPDGRVVERDVLEFLAKVMVGEESLDPTPEPLPAGMEAWPEEDVAGFGLGSNSAGRQDDLSMDDLQAELVQASKQPAEAAVATEVRREESRVSVETPAAFGSDDDLLEVDFDMEPVSLEEPGYAMRGLPDVAATVVDAPALGDEFDVPFGHQSFVDDFGQADENVYAAMPEVNEHHSQTMQGFDTPAVDPFLVQEQLEHDSLEDDLFLFDGDAGFADEPEQPSFGVPSLDYAAQYPVDDVVEEEPAIFAVDLQSGAESRDTFRSDATPELDGSASTFEAFVASRAATEALETQPAVTVLESEDDFAVEDVVAEELVTEELVTDELVADEVVVDDVFAFQGAGSFGEDMAFAHDEFFAPTGDDGDQFMPVDVPLVGGMQDDVVPATGYAMQHEVADYAADAAGGVISDVVADDLGYMQQAEAFVAEAASVAVMSDEQVPDENLPVVPDVAPVSEPAAPSAHVGFVAEEEAHAPGVLPVTVPFVSYGLLLRRHLDLTALTEAQHAVGHELNGDGPVTPAVFLIRAAAKALKSVPLSEAPTVGLAVISDAGFGVHQVANAAEMAFGSLLEAVREVVSAAPAQDRATLVVADLSAFDVDEAVLNVGVPVLTLGRIMYDSATGTYRSTLSLSGDVSPAQGATLLGRVAELLDSPVRLAI
jgi:hypothetical protein